MNDAFVHFIFMVLAGTLGLIEAKHKLLPRPPQNPEFRAFQIKYLRVYYAALFADWLQGPYLYRLYERYGYLQQQIAALYAVGYVAAMVSGPLLGGMADKHGRKKMCLIFCGTYALSCLCKLSPAFFLLMLGRVLGGVSTALLTSTFEAWMVSEHNRLGFPSDWLPKTFALATFGNGVLAVAAGIVANLLADPMGSEDHHPVRPFVLAIGVLMATAYLLNKSWEESKPQEDELSGRDNIGTCVAGLKPIVKQRKVFLLGVTQGFFEAAMFTFVFLWTPALAEHKYRSPLGFIFATFMLAIVLGSTAFQLALELKWTVSRCLETAIVIAIACFLASYVFDNPSAHFVAFVGFEIACGIYYPAIGSLRGELIPEAERAATMGWFRVPINVLTIVLMFATRVLSHHALFGACAVMCGLALMAHKRLMAAQDDEKDGPTVPTGVLPVKDVPGSP
mmetsp:Transcript_8659/g.22393  ORF Transcript_8659/g.22393 Transcript_8659/m.22393 type:complete len:450 (+) Transcript_8659:55-1404(+)